jgi:hypothetical protein
VLAFREGTGGSSECNMDIELLIRLGDAGSRRGRSLLFSLGLCICFKFFATCTEAWNHRAEYASMLSMLLGR